MIESRAYLFLGVLALALLAEQFLPLRPFTQHKLKRRAINLGYGALGLAVAKTLTLPMVIGVAQLSAMKGFGLLRVLEIRGAWAIVLGFLLLDYTLWIWHWLNHRVEFFWRFHQVHHLDLDLDTTTGSRFHVGELLLSGFYRSAQVALIGVDLATWVLFEIAITTASQFHHGNIRLPANLDRAISFVFVTPRMHGIHHSIVREETDSNFSTVFSVWDRIHRLFREGIPQSAITIGVPYCRDPKETGFWKGILYPSRKAHAWKLPSGEVPRREPKPESLAGSEKK